MYKKLIADDDAADDVEEQQLKTPLVVKPTAIQRQRRGGGVGSCLCKCALITTALLVALGAILTTCTYLWVEDVVQHLTIATPHAKFPVVEMTEAELEAVKDRVGLFVDELIAGKTTTQQRLVVTQDEINAFIGHSDYLRGNMWVTLSPGSIKEEYSLPTQMLPGGAGRYFVGSDYVKINEEKGTIEAEMDSAATHEDWFDGPLLFARLQYLVKKHDDGEDQLELYLRSGSIFGQEAPADFINQRKNLLEELYEDSDNRDARAVLEGVESVTIEDGAIVVTPHKTN